MKIDNSKRIITYKIIFPDGRNTIDNYIYLGDFIKMIRNNNKMDFIGVNHAGIDIYNNLVFISGYTREKGLFCYNMED